MASAPKLERLMNLTAALLEAVRPLTARDVQQKVSGYPADRAAFKRAFERDKDDLREMGIPIDMAAIPYSDPPEDGYRIRKDRYYLRDPKLEPDELAALHLAASTVRLEGLDATSGLWKLGGLPAGVEPAGASNQAPGTIAPIPADERVVALFSAVAERRRATFTYRGARREVDPYRLDFQRGHWYVSGFDHLRDASRVYRLDRFESGVEVGSPKAFTRPEGETPGGRLDPWELGEGEPVHARVLVDAEQAPMAVAQVGSEAVAEARDGGAVVIELPVTNADGFRSFVLGFLDHAEVLSPPELRADIVAWLQTIAERP